MRLCFLVDYVVLQHLI